MSTVFVIQRAEKFGALKQSLKELVNSANNQRVGHHFFLFSSIAQHHNLAVKPCWTFVQTLSGKISDPLFHQLWLTGHSLCNTELESCFHIFLLIKPWTNWVGTWRVFVHCGLFPCAKASWPSLRWQDDLPQNNVFRLLIPQALIQLREERRWEESNRIHWGWEIQPTKKSKVKRLDCVNVLFYQTFNISCWLPTRPVGRLGRSFDE